METTKINNLKINVLTKNQYDIANKDENQIYLITDNTETESSKGIIYLIASGTDAVTTSSENDNITELKNGDRFSITFTDALNANATLNINGIGNYPIIDNYTSEAIVLGDISAGYVGDIMFENERFVLLNAYRAAATPTGNQMFTASDTFVVPARVTSIRVSACAAGVSPYAGEGVVNQIYNVEPGQEIPLTIGNGNTIIGDLITLIAGASSASTPTTKLGYATGYSGGKGYSNGGHGGYFGYGGGGGGNTAMMSSTGGGGGGGDGGNGANGAAGGYTDGSYGAGGKGGGTTGGAGGKSSNKSGSANGSDALSGSPIYAGGVATTYCNAGGAGSIYGAGGGGGANTFSSNGNYGGGGGAGGYGAGGGQSGRSGANGTPSNGMVLIEWGFTL